MPAGFSTTTRCSSRWRIVNSSVCDRGTRSGLASNSTTSPSLSRRAGSRQSSPFSRTRRELTDWRDCDQWNLWSGRISGPLGFPGLDGLSRARRMQATNLGMPVYCAASGLEGEKELPMTLSFCNSRLALAAAALIAGSPMGTSVQALPVIGSSQESVARDRQDQDAIRGLREQDAAAARTANQLNAGTEQSAAVAQAQAAGACDKRRRGT